MCVCVYVCIYVCMYVCMYKQMKINNDFKRVCFIERAYLTIVFMVVVQDYLIENARNYY